MDLFTGYPRRVLCTRGYRSGIGQGPVGAESEARYWRLRAALGLADGIAFSADNLPLLSWK
jgi:hypothetical protein